jgi:pimeloyl-ACP methyl ester carboxylesterase
LITSGEVDWQVPTRYGRAVHERVAGSKLHVFTGPYSSHMAFVEMADEFNRLTLDFLTKPAA